MNKLLSAGMAVLMTGAMAFGVAACGDPSDGGNPSGDGGNSGTEPMEITSAFDRGDYLARGVDDHYVVYDDASGLSSVGYYNALEGGTDGTANCYEYSSLIDMAISLYEASEDEADKEYYKSLMEGYIDGLQYYRGSGELTSTHGTAVWDKLYAVQRQAEPDSASIAGVNMVYDDLMWLIRDFISAYEITGNEDYLAQAEYMAKCCLDGWDSTKGGIGGITWGPGYGSKHTCSNAPFISALCRLAEIYADSDDKITEEDTVFAEQKFSNEHVEWESMVGMKKSEYYLHWAKEVYNFTYTYLRNTDNTFADNLRSAEEIANDESAPGGKYKYFAPYTGEISREKFTYNVGAMVSGAAWLYKLTGEESYLEQGCSMMEAAHNHFAKTVTLEDGTQMQMYDCRTTLYFNTVLLRGYIDMADAVTEKKPANSEDILAEAESYIGVFKSSLDYAFDNYLLNRTLPHNYLQGWLYGDDTIKNTFDSHKDVKDATASPVLYGLIAGYEATYGEIK